FSSFKHPELIIFGLKSDTNIKILNNIGDDVKKGKVFEAGPDYSEVLASYPVTFREVLEQNYINYFGFAIWYYKRKSFPVLQVIWPDKNSRYPWDPDFDRSLFLEEPLLDREPEWSFRELKNFGVFTTRRVIEDHLPILLVAHDREDGAWQFLCGTTN